MIYLRKGQPLADNSGMVMYDPTGYYNDGDSVICAPAGVPDEPACRYEAKFVAYGGLVYSISDPDELMEQILRLDPNTLFGKDTKQVAVDRAVEQIVPQMAGVVDDPATATSTPATNIPPDTQIATTTPPVITPPITTSTTTPPFVLPDTGTSTTTPPFTASTSTPPLVLPDVGTSTTTPPFSLSTTTPEVFISGGSGATTTPPEILFSGANISTTTPNITPPNTTASTSETTIIENNPPGTLPSVLETPTNTSTTTDEVVAFAKKIVKNKISKSLGL
jgi:hypothetical protein